MVKGGVITCFSQTVNQCPAPLIQYSILFSRMPQSAQWPVLCSPIILPHYPLPLGDNPRPTLPCDYRGAQQSQLELGIGAGTGRPVTSMVSTVSWPRTGTGPWSPGVSFLGTLHTDTSQGHFLLWLRAVKVEAWNYQQPHLLFLQQQKGSPLATGEKGPNPEEGAKSGRWGIGTSSGVAEASITPRVPQVLDQRNAFAWCLLNPRWRIFFQAIILEKSWLTHRLWLYMKLLCIAGPGLRLSFQVYCYCCLIQGSDYPLKSLV